MKQATIGAPAQTAPFHPRAAAATVTDVMRPPLTAAGQYDHVAAAAYLMKHAGTTALMVVDARTGRPAGIITQADVARAIAAGKDLNDVRVHAVMTTRPAITTTTSIREAATIMTTRHFRHLPVAGDTGLLGLIDITDVCQALRFSAGLAEGRLDRLGLEGPRRRSLGRIRIDCPGDHPAIKPLAGGTGITGIG